MIILIYQYQRNIEIGVTAKAEDMYSRVEKDAERKLRMNSLSRNKCIWIVNIRMDYHMLETVSNFAQFSEWQESQKNDYIKKAKQIMHNVLEIPISNSKGN